MKEDATEEDIFDFELPLKTRVEIFKKVGTFSTVHRLISLLNISNSSLVRKMLVHLCIFELTVPEVWRLEIAYTLIENDRENQTQDQIGYRALDIALFNDRNIHSISMACKIKACVCLNNGMPHLRRVYLYLLDILTDKELSCEYRYRIVQGLTNGGDSEEKVTEELLEFCLATFIAQVFEPEALLFKVLACQLCLVGSNARLCTYADKELVLTLSQPIDINLKADIADMILQFSGDCASKSLAGDVLASLAFDSTCSAKTIYDNRENIHTSTVFNSALQTINALTREVKHPQFFSAQTLEELYSKHKPELSGTPTQTTPSATTTTQAKKVLLNVYDRIRYFDNAVYSSCKLSLMQTLNTVWTFIQHSSLRWELERRLLEEMFEMSDTCSSGYFVRLANVLSGLSGTLGVQIGWDDQIKSVFFAKINTLIRNDPNRDSILENLATDSEDKQSYQAFIVNSLPLIIEEVKEEFKECLSEDDIDIYLRRSLSLFEGCDFSRLNK